MRHSETQESAPESRRRPEPATGSNRHRPADTPPLSRSLSCFGDLIVVSNRQPYRHEFDEVRGDGNSSDSTGTGDPVSDGGAGRTLTHEPEQSRSIAVDTPSGGLTAGLDPVLQRTGGTWIAWGDGDADRAVVDDRDCVRVPPADAETEDGDTYSLRRLWLSEDDLEAYYYGFSNRVLWPLCHGRPELVDDRGDLGGYRRVNEQFADAVADHASPSSLVWLQDYHLGLAPRLLQERLPSSTTVGQFWHVPWPRPDVFRRCPHGRELLVGLLGNDLLGFHVDRWADAFLESVDRLLPAARVDRRRRTVTHDGTTTRVLAVPMGVDADRHDRAARSVERDRLSSFRDEHGIDESVSLGVGVDRLDYSKGIPQRLAAVERLFERWPAWRGSFTYVQTATPSRTEIPAYDELGAFVRSEVERITDRFGTDHWQPIVYTEDYLSRETLSALYRDADAVLVTPLRDGMNLVAQEAVAASVDDSGALLLSEHAGAHDLLGDAAYSLDPHDVEDVAESLEAALAAPPSETRRRMRDLRQRVFAHDLEWWMARQFAALAAVAEDQPTAEDQPAADGTQGRRHRESTSSGVERRHRGRSDHRTRGNRSRRPGGSTLR